MKNYLLALTIGALLLAPSIANARPHHRHHHGHHVYETGRPAGCPHAWCGCWARIQKGINDVRLNLAAAWKHVGTPAAHGCIDCIAVIGNHHVGIVKGYDAKGNVILLSGNHGHKVGIGTYARSRVSAYRNV